MTAGIERQSRKTGVVRASPVPDRETHPGDPGRAPALGSTGRVDAAASAPASSWRSRPSSAGDLRGLRRGGRAGRGVGDLRRRGGRPVRRDPRGRRDGGGGRIERVRRRPGAGPATGGAKRRYRERVPMLLPPRLGGGPPRGIAAGRRAEATTGRTFPRIRGRADDRRIAVRRRPGDELAAEREAFLDEACAGDVALRQRVERLLAAHEKTLGILDRPAAPPGTPEVTAGPPPAAPRRASASAPWSPAATSCSRRSARGAWAPSGWPSRRSRSAARSP